MTTLGLRVMPAAFFRVSICCLFILSGVLAAGVSAQTNTTWITTTGNWSNATNWNNGVPNGNFNALIGNGSAPMPTATLDINAAVNELTLDSGAVFITGGHSLGAGMIAMSGSGSSISGATGSEMVNAGTIMGSGTISNTGVGANALYATGGTLTINSSSLGISTDIFQVDAGSKLVLAGGPLSSLDYSSGTFHPRVADIAGTMQIANANITTIFGVGDEPFILDGPGNHIVDQFGNNALRNLSTVFNSSLELTNGATLSTAGNFTFNASAGMNVLNGSSLNVKDDFSFCCILAISGSTVNVGGTWTNTNTEAALVNISAGSTVNDKGTFTNISSFGISAGLSISGGSALNITGDLNNLGTQGSGTYLIFSQASKLTVKGSVTSDGPNALLEFVGGSTFSVQGDLNNSNSGSLTLATGSSGTVKGTLTNSGSVGVDGTSVLNAKGGFVQTAGSSVIDGTLNASHGANIQAGTLSGTGILNGNLRMAGTMTPGDPTGAFTLNGNYTQTSSGTLAEQVGWLSGSNATLFKVNGNATLSGTLALSLLSGYDPTVGDSFILMTFLSDTGIFGTITGTDLGNGLFLDVLYDPHDVRVEAEPVGTPEPSSSVLLLVGCLAVLAAARKRLAKRILPAIS